MRVSDMEKVGIEGLKLTALQTPGHTSESYSFLMDDRVFSGNTLLIRGTGRTDFQNDDLCDQYRSLFERLFKLPEQTLVYPAHDFKRDTVTTFGKEKAQNPRLRVGICGLSSSRLGKRQARTEHHPESSIGRRWAK